MELIRRTMSEKGIAFSNFMKKIRMTFCFYISLDYVCNNIDSGVKKVEQLK